MKTFRDSNVLVYLLEDSNNAKKKIVKGIISPDHFISTQVIAENVNVCLKKLRLNKATAFSHGKNLLQKFNVLTIETSTIERSFLLSNTYNLSFWDSYCCNSAAGGLYPAIHRRYESRSHY